MMPMQSSYMDPYGFPDMGMGMGMMSSGDDTTIVFIILILACCCIFIVFGYLYWKENEDDDDDETNDCDTFSTKNKCDDEDECQWDELSLTCEDSSSSGTTCGINKRVSNGRCVSCPKYSNGSYKATRPAGDPVDGGDTQCTLSPCPKDYHVVSGECVACPAGTINAAGDDPISGGDTTCQRALCLNTQRIVCAAEGNTGSCGERCCCEDCPDGQESSKVPDQSPDSATASDPACVPLGTGASLVTSSSGSSTTLPLCDIGYRVNDNHECVQCPKWASISDTLKDEVKASVPPLYTPHDPNGAATLCETAEAAIAIPCGSGKKSMPISVAMGGMCSDCPPGETNDGPFVSTDPAYETCLKCEHDHYVDAAGNCTPCGGRKINIQANGESFLKANYPSGQEQNNVCRTMCTNTEEVVCTQGSGGWSCVCSACSNGESTRPGGNISPAEDYVAMAVGQSGPTWVPDNTRCVNQCDGAYYTDTYTRIHTEITRCILAGDCNESNLTIDKTTLEELNGACEGGPYRTRIAELITLIESTINTLPCAPTERIDNGVCGPCPSDAGQQRYGSYPPGRQEVLPDTPPAHVSRSTSLNTTCKRQPCAREEALKPVTPRDYSGEWTCERCPQGFVGVSEEVVTGGTPGQHNLSPDDADRETDETFCRDPNAVTCSTVSESDRARRCGVGYHFVTDTADLGQNCEGQTCSINVNAGVRSSDHETCCRKNETCAGRILYEGNVGNVSSTGRITLNIPGETNNLSSEISNKKIIFTIPPPPAASTTTSRWTRASCIAAISAGEPRGGGCTCSNDPDCLSGNCKDDGYEIYGGRNLSGGPNSGESGCKIPATPAAATSTTAPPTIATYTGTISNYEYLTGLHKISVTYDDDGSGIPSSGGRTITFKIIETPSSTCPSGMITTNDPNTLCVGETCDFNNLTDQGSCCIIFVPGRRGEACSSHSDCEQNVTRDVASGVDYGFICDWNGQPTHTSAGKCRERPYITGQESFLEVYPSDHAWAGSNRDGSTGDGTAGVHQPCEKDGDCHPTLMCELRKTGSPGYYGYKKCRPVEPVAQELTREAARAGR